MKERKREFDETKITGFFDKDTEINGDLKFQGSFRIDGHFKGNIDSESMLIIGENGKVEADIKIGFIIIDGEVKGNIQATDKAEIHSKGRVFGTIITPKLVIEEGAYLEANCQTTDKLPAPMPETPLPEENMKDTGSEL
ncbi:MAG: polymer-forming cytoskeletal protein [Candidatus Aminicenantes bacterium]|nr:polymer-forming cytoskeletal protein [Candidatus Aminicenantes bacterium]